MGLLPPIKEVSATQSGFEELKSLYGSCYGRINYANSRYYINDYILMADSPIYFGYITNNSNFDGYLRANGFPGEGHRNPRVLLLSNIHYTGTAAHYQYWSSSAYNYTDFSTRIITINNLQYYGYFFYVTASSMTASSVTSSPYTLTGYYTDSYSTCEDMISAIGVEPIGENEPITYRLTNCTTTGPDSAPPRSRVSIPLTFPTGYNIIDPLSDVYVTNNGVIIPSSYTNGTINFTMP